MATRLRTERVRLNQGGYDRGGRYYGSGAPLYRVYDDEGEIDEVVRAKGSAEARLKVAVAKGLRTMSARQMGYHPLYGRVDRLRREARAGLRTVENNKRFLRRADTLRAQVRALLPDDYGWRFFYSPFERASRLTMGRRKPFQGEVADEARSQIDLALNALTGIASRIPTTPAAARDPRRSKKITRAVRRRRAERGRARSPRSPRWTSRSN